jgi:hypothetical protein
MNTPKLLLALAVSACVFANAHAQAQARETAPRSAVASAPTINLREASESTGRLFPRNIHWDSKIPLNKTYGQLTAEQIAALRDMYESIPDYEEPPFPLEGIRPIYNAVNKAQLRIQATGELNMSVTVGPDGKATKVVDYGKNNRPEITQFAADVLLLTKYKPALCKGVPCTMSFPFHVKLQGQSTNLVAH